MCFSVFCKCFLLDVLLLALEKLSAVILLYCLLYHLLTIYSGELGLYCLKQVNYFDFVYAFEVLVYYRFSFDCSMYGWLLWFLFASLWMSWKEQNEDFAHMA